MQQKQQIDPASYFAAVRLVCKWLKRPVPKGDVLVREYFKGTPPHLVGQWRVDKKSQK